MELLLQSSPLTTLPSSSRNISLLKHPILSDQNSPTFSYPKRCPIGGKLKCRHSRAQALESIRASTQSSTETTDGVNQESASKDENVVFVAGATGKVGSRTVRELLKLGFQVRAGVRSAKRAETLVQSVQQLKLDDGASAVERLEIVECDLEQDRIEPAIANASSVICCIGASEKEVFDITGPYRIDYQATKNLIDAATASGVNHFILLTSLGTNKIGFPAAILNLFWGVLVWKRKAEEALIASGLPYTIVRPGGMERPTDSYKETHNVSLSKEDTLFGGQVSNLQVAELLAFMTRNPDLSYCKVVEVIAETTAPLSPFGELLTKLPSKRVNRSSRKSVVPVATTSVSEEEPVQAKVPIVRPSSYILYQDSEKPASPTPTPSTSQAATTDVKAQVTETKPVSLQDSSKEPLKSASDKEVSPETGIKPVSLQESSTEPVQSASDKDVSPKDLKKPDTLSPYISYDDLKPPSSPTPSASSGETKKNLDFVQAVSDPTTEVEVPEVATTTTETIPTPLEVQDTRPLSPYFAYEDLKPPTSPIPSKPENGAVPSSVTSVVVEETPIEVVEETPPSQKTSYLSPFPVYDDFKPPASPSPAKPQTVSPLLSSITDAEPESSPEPEIKTTEAAMSAEVEDSTHSNEPKQSALSPFAMYEDLKPPSSPIPSAPKY